MKTTFTRILSVVFTALAAGMAMLSGIGKLLALPQVIELLTKMGVAAHINQLAIMEISFALLYLMPATRKLGFVLLTAYFSGALAVELSHNSALVAIGPLVVIWVSAFLQDRSIFLPTKSSQSPVNLPWFELPAVG